MNYTKENPLRVFTSFSGYDSQCLALEQLKELIPGFSYTLVGWSEIDKYAIQAHNALFPEAADLNYGDISKIDWSQVPDFDLFTYSFPCTDISAAGLQKGLSKDSGTRSGLLWECEKTIKYKRPKFLLMENVKALVSKKFLPDFNAWLELLNNYGYDTFWQVCNAKDYGVPQNRERVFAISYRQDLCLPRYIFPDTIPLDKCIEDVLEDEVDEKYFLADERVEGLIESTLKEQKAGRGYKFEPKTKDDIAGHVSTKGGARKTDNFVKVVNNDTDDTNDR